ncbi:MAG: 50S ribosomal protein L40e [Nanohaloarchaea archaeon]|nr:50S ribosomal protein L40e [Candidatus Nanohaloarchaea archaeon]
MAQRFEEAKKRIFGDVYVCRKCNATNRTEDPESSSCRKCGYSNLRPKNAEFAG